jgi:hypothetical protein
MSKTVHFSPSKNIKMRLLVVLVLSAFSIAAYSQKGKKKEVNIDEYPVKMRVILGKPLDSLMTYSWVIPEALDIINGKKQPKDDKTTFTILEKSTGADADTRPLYIHILAYTNWYATEAGLADSLGKYNMRLLERFPKEALRYFKKSETDKRIEDAEKAFNYNIAFELNAKDDPEGAFAEWEEKVYKIYKSKNTEELDKTMKAIRKQMKKK